MVITLCSAIMAASKGYYKGLAYFLVWVSADIAGAIIATLFYDNFFEPNVEYVRNLKRDSENQ